MVKSQTLELLRKFLEENPRLFSHIPPFRVKISQPDNSVYYIGHLHSIRCEVLKGEIFFYLGDEEGILRSEDVTEKLKEMRIEILN